MDTRDSAFDWFDPANGFAWSQAAALARADRQPRAEAAVSTRTYSAHRENSGLFLSFAETHADVGEVLKFLFHCAYRLQRHAGRAPADLPELPDLLGGRDLTEWVAAARWMRLLIALWRLLQARDRAGLARHIRWIQDQDAPARVIYLCQRHDHPGAQLPPEGISEPIASSDVRPDWLQVFKPQDLFGPAVAFLMAKISGFLAGTVTSQFLMEIKSNQLRLEPVPQTLFGLLWLQFAMSVAEAKEYERCRTCCFWFERSPATARSNRRFCSNACRSRMHRARQEHAQRRYQEGVPPSRIAQELGTSVRTVRGWLKPRHDE